MGIDISNWVNEVVRAYESFLGGVRCCFFSFVRKVRSKGTRRE